MKLGNVKGNGKQCANRFADDPPVGMIRQAGSIGKEEAEQQIRSVENRSII